MRRRRQGASALRAPYRNAGEGSAPRLPELRKVSEAGMQRRPCQKHRASDAASALECLANQLLAEVCASLQAKDSAPHCFTAERLAARADRLTERTGSCRNFGRSARKSASRPPALELRTAEARAVGPNPLGRMRVRRTVHQSAAAGGRIFWVWAAPAHSKPTPMVLPIKPLRTGTLDTRPWPAVARAYPVLVYS